MKKLILCEGISDAMVIKHLIGTGPGTPKRNKEIRVIEKPSTRKEGSETWKKVLKEIDDFDLYILCTRGKDLLNKTVRPIIDKKNKIYDIKIYVIFDKDGSEENHISQTLKKEEEKIPKDYSKASLVSFGFKQDLETLLIAYLKEYPPDWFNKVIEKFQPCWGDILAKSFDEWISAKNKECFLRLVHMAQHHDGNYIGKFPESFIEHFGLCWDKLQNIDEGKLLCEFLKDIF